MLDKGKVSQRGKQLQMIMMIQYGNRDPSRQGWQTYKNNLSLHKAG